MRLVVLIILLLGLTQVSFAQDDTKTKFYNFDNLLINGAYKKPAVLYTDRKKKLKFDKLLNLKKDFLSKLENTSDDVSLR
jgi:hypothetical protein